jgi:hypothetical protein
MSWYYLRRTTENENKPCYAVGHYNPATGDWIQSSVHDTEEEAMQKVNYLNGGDPDYLQSEYEEDEYEEDEDED